MISSPTQTQTTYIGYVRMVNPLCGPAYLYGCAKGRTARIAVAAASVQLVRLFVAKEQAENREVG